MSNLAPCNPRNRSRCCLDSRENRLIRNTGGESESKTGVQRIPAAYAIDGAGRATMEVAHCNYSADLSLNAAFLCTRRRGHLSHSLTRKKSVRELNFLMTNCQHPQYARGVRLQQRGRAHR